MSPEPQPEGQQRGYANRLWRLGRHALSVAILPGTVLAVIPMWLLRARTHADVRWTETALYGLSRGLGVILFAAGLGAFTWCVTLFARMGQGTLAPWDPTRRLVAAGPYRYVRNPMIMAVALMLAGEALFFGSMLVTAWAGLFIAINHLYFRLVEEPGLERRFGADYVAYRRQVPRWIPRRPDG